jgi:HTH-type transcriptional regulator, glycine betaine synthesis regulator
MKADETEAPLSPAERIVSDSIGRLIEFWGFKRNMGRIWGVLYLASAPVTARALRERLVLSTGSVSTTLNELQRWGVVKRVHVDGSRQEHFAAEINLWKMVSRVFRERELLEIVEAISAFEDALAKLPENGTPLERMQRERIGNLLEVARMGRTLVDALVSTGRVDASDLVRQIFLGKSEK